MTTPRNLTPLTEADWPTSDTEAAVEVACDAKKKNTGDDNV
jgi:hypothetical protein